MPKQYIAQLQSTGFGDHLIGTLECLGMVDRDTIRNLTRSFSALQEEQEQKNARSLSPVSHQLRQAEENPLNFFSAGTLSDVIPANVFQDDVGPSDDEEVLKMQNKEGSSETPAQRRILHRQDVATFKFCADETRPQTPAQPITSSEASMQARESMAEKREGLMKGRSPASSNLRVGTLIKADEKSLQKDEGKRSLLDGPPVSWNGSLLDGPPRPKSAYGSKMPGTALVGSAVRTLLQDLNASPDTTMRSILELSRDNHQHGDRILRCNDACISAPTALFCFSCPFALPLTTCRS
jgi:hypothetical protein